MEAKMKLSISLSSFLCFSAIFLPILILFSQSALSNADNESEYTTFVKCLGENSSPDDTVSSIVYAPQNSSFSSVLQAYIRNKRFNTSETPKPILIVTPKTESHVQSTVICAKNMGIQLKIRSGGHDYDGLSYVCNNTFIILDMFNLRNIDVNIEEETAFVEAGATMGELYYSIWKKSDEYGFPGGVCPTLGVGGHITGCGYGNMMRKYGLSVDNVIDAKIVDAKGQSLDRKSMGEDLFWAIRGGGGGSFGVILSYTIKLVKVPKVVSVFMVPRSLDENAIDIVHRYQSVAIELDNDLYIRLMLLPTTVKGQKTMSAVFVGMFLGDSSRLIGLMDQEFPELGLKKVDCVEMSWVKSLLFWAGYDNKTSADQLLSRNSNLLSFGKRKSDYLTTPIPKDGLQSLWNKMVEFGSVRLYFNPYGGRVSEIPTWETPCYHRGQNLIKVQYLADWEDEGPEADKIHMSQIRSLYSFMTPFVTPTRMAFLNYRDTDIGVNHNGNNSYVEGKVYGDKIFVDNFERLVKVKSTVDPENFFRHEQSIPVKKDVQESAAL